MINDIEWGDAPTWIGAIGASLAAWAAFRTLRSQRRQISEQQVFIAEQLSVLDLQRAALLEDAEDRRTAQARLIRVEYSVAPGGALHALVHNNSDQPIREVNARFGAGYPTRDAAILARGTEPQLSAGVPVATLGPGRTAVLSPPPLSPETQEASPPTVTFTGADGSRWETDRHNHVRPAPPAPAP